MYHLPPALRATLAAPFGPVYQTHRTLQETKGRTILAVGDVVTQTFLDAGVVPKLMVVDGVTQRGSRVENALQGLPSHGVRRVEVQNPPATITMPLIAAIDRAMREKGSTLLVVKGEEDLAALPAIVIAPDGAVVCYGQPPTRAYAGADAPRQAADGGVVVVHVNPETRRRAQEILQQMEVK